MKWRSFFIQLAVGLVCAGLVLLIGGMPEGTADRVRAVDDAFTVVALLYLSFGALLWVSSTGFFDIFGFAVRRGLHAFLPGFVTDPAADYYEYREERRGKRKSRSIKSTFFAGVFLLIVSIVLTIVWYQI